jgi:hypothetical protein
MNLTRDLPFNKEPDFLAQLSRAKKSGSLFLGLLFKKI